MSKHFRARVLIIGTTCFMIRCDHWLSTRVLITGFELSTVKLVQWYRDLNYSLNNRQCLYFPCSNKWGFTVFWNILTNVKMIASLNIVFKYFPHNLTGEFGNAPGTASSYLMQSNYDMDIYGEAPDKMTYTEQANKREHCKRLTW